MAFSTQVLSTQNKFELDGDEFPFQFEYIPLTSLHAHQSQPPIPSNAPLHSSCPPPPTSSPRVFIVVNHSIRNTIGPSVNVPASCIATAATASAVFTSTIKHCNFPCEDHPDADDNGNCHTADKPVGEKIDCHNLIPRSLHSSIETSVT